MRTLSDVEASVVAAMLGSGLEAQSQAISKAGLVRSSYTVVRRRAFSEGWLYERGVPSASLGFSRVVFTLMRPFADRSDEIAVTLSEEEGAVLVWQSVEMVFGVFFLGSEVSGEKWFSGLADMKGVQGLATWSIVPDGSNIPVYFDYEGVWGHLTGSHPNLYPRPLLSASHANGSEGFSMGLMRNAYEMVRRPFRGDAIGGEIHRFGPAGFPRSWRRLLSKGFMDWRIFPNFTHIPPYRGSQLSRVAFIHGDLRDGMQPSSLFGEMVQGSRVFPFLYAIEGKKVLMGAMGRGKAPPSGIEDSRAPLLPLLQRYLTRVDVVTSDIENLKVRLDHRYDRLFT